MQQAWATAKVHCTEQPPPPQKCWPTSKQCCIVRDALRYRCAAIAAVIDGMVRRSLCALSVPTRWCSRRALTQVSNCWTAGPTFSLPTCNGPKRELESYEQWVRQAYSVTSVRNPHFDEPSVLHLLKPSYSGCERIPTI